MKKKVFLISITLMVFTALSVNAQRLCDKQGPGKRGKQNPEMKAYIEANVLPVMKIQREELDKQLDAADKTRLEEIRAELKSMRTIIKDKRDAFRDSDKKPTMEQRKEMREHRDKVHMLMNEVETMSEKYDVAITDALESIRENAETWKQEMSEFRPNQKSGKGDRPQCNMNGSRKGNHQEKGNHQKKGNHQGFHNDKERGVPMQRFMSPEGFLLWNPEEPMPMFEDDNINEIGLNINLFPNPASESVQVSLMLTQDENIKIEILDKDGKVVFDAKSENASEGLFTKTLNVSSFENGIYFVKIKAGTKTIVERLIIQK